MLNNIAKTEKVYSVLELNTVVRDIIKAEFPDHIWVCGEIQGLRPERDKKHTYFELVQKHPEADEIMAKVRIALFANRKPLILERIQKTELPFELKNDIEVKLLCEVSLHAPTGQYSLIAIDIDPVYTLGKVAQNRQRIIEELKKQGLLEKNKLCSISTLPLKVGLITALDSAAYHDFVNELSLSGYGFKVNAFNCHMQGKNVEKDVLRALKYFNSLSPDKLDVIVITRGGGSTADLSWFDNKKIAEKIALSRYPVITALGHQIDLNITDLVAHTSLKTPTKSAQFLTEKITQQAQELDSLESDIIQCAQLLLEDRKKELETVAVKLESFISRYFIDHRQNILTLGHQIKQVMAEEFQKDRLELNRKFELIKFNLAKFFEHSQDKLRYAQDKTVILDPRNVFKRGYSMVLKNGKAIKSIDEIDIHDKVKTVLYKGSFLSEVTRKETL